LHRDFFVHCKSTIIKLLFLKSIRQRIPPIVKTRCRNSSSTPWYI